MSIMKIKDPLVSYVILSWNTLDDTKNCIQSILKQSYKNIQLVVVDNGSTDGSKDYLSNLKDITYVDMPKNTGFTGGQIAARNHCKGDYLALINSDAVLADNWTEACLEVFEHNNKAAAVGGKAFTWNNANPVGSTDNQFYSYQKINLLTGLTETYQSGETEIEVDSISGAAVMIKNSVINKVGYFDSDFFAYYEETDLFARMLRAGYRIIYQPKALVWHQIAKSSNGNPYFYLYQMHRNRFLFGYKNIDDGFEFAKRYFLDGLRAYKSYLKNNSDLETKAKAKSAAWNLRHILTTHKKRIRILRLGNSYSAIINNHRLGNDVTIIIPSYNYKEYIKDAIYSAINQSHKPTRIIVIDDGSKDGSPALAKSIKANGIQYEVVVKENEGVIATKNLGIKMSTTTWTIFLDADDILEPNYIKETLKSAMEFNSDVVYTDMQYFGAKNGNFYADDFSHRRIIEGNFVHNSALINTTLLKRSGGYKQEMHDGYEDWELYLTLAEIGAKFAKCTTTHLNYRQHPGTLSRNKRADSNGAEIMQKALSFHKEYITRVLYEPSKIKRASLTFMKNPELLIFIMPTVIYSLVKSLKEYFIAVRQRTVRIIKLYLRYKKKA
jgi:GT2 family glycosyltransferase